MKKRVIIGIISAVLLAELIMGIVFKRTYTQVTKTSDYLDGLVVAQIPEDLALNECSTLKKKLPDSQYIFCVSATDGTVEHFSFMSRQKVNINRIYKKPVNSKICEGEDIYITCDRWSLVLKSDFSSIERGFVNILNTDENYLVFIDSAVDSLWEDRKIYKLTGNSIIAPVFSYNDHENVICPMNNKNTYVDYRNVRNNEFFVSSETALNAMMDLKKEMIELYPF